MGSKHLQEYFFSLNLSEIFIVPGLSILDHAAVNDQFIDDLQDSIRAREKILTEFETAISKIVQIENRRKKSRLFRGVKKKKNQNRFLRKGLLKNFITW